MVTGEARGSSGWLIELRAARDQGVAGWKYQIWQYITVVKGSFGEKNYNDVIMNMMASQITGVFDCLLNHWFGADQRKHQSSASLAFVMGIHRWPVNSPNKGPVTRKMFPFDDAIMEKLSQLLTMPLYSCRNFVCRVSASNRYQDILWTCFNWD